jgi:phage-related holin
MQIDMLTQQVSSKPRVTLSKSANIKDLFAQLQRLNSGSRLNIPSSPLLNNNTYNGNEGQFINPFGYSYLIDYIIKNRIAISHVIDLLLNSQSSFSSVTLEDLEQEDSFYYMKRIGSAKDATTPISAARQSIVGSSRVSGAAKQFQSPPAIMPTLIILKYIKTLTSIANTDIVAGKLPGAQNLIEELGAAVVRATSNDWLSFFNPDIQQSLFELQKKIFDASGNPDQLLDTVLSDPRLKQFLSHVLVLNEIYSGDYSQGSESVRSHIIDLISGIPTDPAQAAKYLNNNIRWDTPVSVEWSDGQTRVDEPPTRSKFDKNQEGIFDKEQARVFAEINGRLYYNENLSKDILEGIFIEGKKQAPLPKIVLQIVTLDGFVRSTIKPEDDVINTREYELDTNRYLEYRDLGSVDGVGVQVIDAQTLLDAYVGLNHQRTDALWDILANEISSLKARLYTKSSSALSGVWYYSTSEYSDLINLFDYHEASTEADEDGFIQNTLVALRPNSDSDPNTSLITVVDQILKYYYVYGVFQKRIAEAEEAIDEVIQSEYSQLLSEAIDLTIQQSSAESIANKTSEILNTTEGMLNTSVQKFIEYFESYDKLKESYNDYWNRASREHASLEAEVVEELLVDGESVNVLSYIDNAKLTLNQLTSSYTYIKQELTSIVTAISGIGTDQYQLITDRLIEIQNEFDELLVTENTLKDYIGLLKVRQNNIINQVRIIISQTINLRYRYFAQKLPRLKSLISIIDNISTYQYNTLIDSFDPSNITLTGTSLVQEGPFSSSNPNNYVEEIRGQFFYWYPSLKELKNIQDTSSPYRNIIDLEDILLKPSILNQSNKINFIKDPTTGKMSPFFLRYDIAGIKSNLSSDRIKSKLQSLGDSKAVPTPIEYGGLQYDDSKIYSTIKDFFNAGLNGIKNEAAISIEAGEVLNVPGWYNKIASEVFVRTIDSDTVEFSKLYIDFETVEPVLDRTMSLTLTRAELAEDITSGTIEKLLCLRLIEFILNIRDIQNDQQLAAYMPTFYKNVSGLSGITPQLLELSSIEKEFQTSFPGIRNSSDNAKIFPIISNDIDFYDYNVKVKEGISEDIVGEFEIISKMYLKKAKLPLFGKIDLDPDEAYYQISSQERSLSKKYPNFKPILFNDFIETFSTNNAGETSRTHWAFNHWTIKAILGNSTDKIRTFFRTSVWDRFSSMSGEIWNVYLKPAYSRLVSITNQDANPIESAMEPGETLEGMSDTRLDTLLQATQLEAMFSFSDIGKALGRPQNIPVSLSLHGSLDGTPTESENLIGLYLEKKENSTGMS